MPLPPAADESERQDVLRQLGVFDTPPEEEFDDLTRLAATICGTPIALVSLLDIDRQWFKSRYGIDATETPRAWAFCDHAVRQSDIFEISDAAADERFATNPLVTSDPRIRFYAGMPLATPEGVAVGTLCVIGRTPRTLSATQKDALRTLARQVVAQLVLRRQAADLRASDARFRAIFDSMFEFIGLLAPDGTLLEANRTALTAAGASLAEVVGKPFPDTIWWTHNPDMQARLRDGIRRAGGGEFVRFEATHPLADGTVAAIDFSLTPVFDPSGAVVMLVPEGRDITTLKRAEDRVRESEERFRTAFEDAAIGMALVAPDGRWLRANRSLSGLLGYTPEELLATDFQTLTHPDDLNADLELVRQVLAGGIATYQLEKRYFHKQGATIHALLSVSLVRGAAGEPLYFVSQIQDITARKVAEIALRESEVKFRGVVDDLAEGVVLLDYDTRSVVRSNHAMHDLLGYTADEFATLTQYDFVAHDRADIDARMADVVRCGRADLGFRKYRRKDGTPVDVSVNGSRLTLKGQTVLCLAVRDMTPVKQAEQAVRSSEDQLRDILENTDELVHRFGLNMQIEYTNRAWRKALGYSEDEAKGLTLARIVHPDDQSLLQTGFARLLAGERVGIEARLVSKSGGVIIVSGVSEMRFDGDRPVYGRTLFRDVTEQRANEELVSQYQAELERANARLKALAHTDALTGVNNRAAFNDRLAEEFARAGRYDRPLSVVLLDVDYFKKFNDSFGHPAGDDVLKRVAGLLRQTVRLTDFVARYGGEEFVALLPDTDYAGAMVLAERLRRAVAGGSWDKRPVTISVGVSTLTATTADASALVKEADDALYQSKHAGRNRVHHSSGAVPMLAAARM